MNKNVRSYYKHHFLEQLDFRYRLYLLGREKELSNKIKIVSIDTSKGTSTRGVFPVTLTVTNSCGDVSYLESTVTFVGAKEDD